MTDQTPIELEMQITIPDVVDGPVQLENGRVFSVNDSVRHPDFGLGRILRFGEYEQLGLVAYVDFDSLGKKEIDIYFLEKVDEIEGARVPQKVVPAEG
jgi:hypothetical protein